MLISDWSSDVCSSDLPTGKPSIFQWGPRSPRSFWGGRPKPCPRRKRVDAVLSRRRPPTGDRKSVVEGKRVSVRVELGGRRTIKKQNENANNHTNLRIHNFRQQIKKIISKLKTI